MSKKKENSKDEELQVLMEITELLGVPEDVDFLDSEIFLLEHPEFKEKPVSFKRFVQHGDYLGLGEDIYRRLIEMGMDIVENEYREIIVYAGIGAGKSTLSQLLACYFTYLLLCYKDPFDHFNLIRDKPIVVINMGLNADQAKNVIFSGISTFITQSLWFRKFAMVKLAKSIKFVDENIMIMSGNSKETAPLGLNVFVGILDEAAFYLDNNHKSIAEDIYDGMNRRITSRFGKAGKIIAVSSARYEGDFIDKSYKQSLEHEGEIFGVMATSWHMKNREVMSEEVFVFDKHNMEIVDDVEISEYMKKNLCLDPDEYDESLNEQYWVIPDDYKLDFKKNPEKSARDFGSMASTAINGFITRKNFIDLASGKTPNRVNDVGVWDLSNPPNERVFVHIDLGLNKDGQGDAAGIAVAYCYGYDNKNEGRPFLRVPFVEQITAGKGGEIQFSDIRKRVFDLKNAGWRIGEVTLDGWQSRDTMQIFNGKGIMCSYLSVDTSMDPYNTLKDSLYMEAVELPDHEVLKTELKQLEVIKGKKVDHPHKGSKDCADAVAGAVYKAVRNAGFKDPAQNTGNARRAQVRWRRRRR